MIEEILSEIKQIRKLLIPNKKVITMDEFCCYAGISKAYAYQLTSQGRIRFYRPFGKMIYFNIDEVNEFLTGHKINNIETILNKANKNIIKNIIK